MKRERGHLRTQAHDAKKRLAGGFWEREKARFKEAKDGESVASTVLRRCFQQEFCESNKKFNDEFYIQVATLCERGITNPLSHIIDHEHVLTLEPAERERYIFNLSRRVRECVTQWETSCAKLVKWA